MKNMFVAWLRKINLDLWLLVLYICNNVQSIADVLAVEKRSADTNADNCSLKLKVDFLGD